MKTLLIVMTLLLAACATPQEFVSRPPDAVIALSGSPQTAALCITRNLENYASNMIVSTRPTADGWEVIGRLTGEATTIYAIAELRGNNTGASATIWAAQQIFTGMDAVVNQIVNGC